MALGRNHKIFNIGNASGTIQGLTRVYHDLTLSGDGTLSSLLGVVGGGADEEVNQYVYDNSATIDEVNTSYQTNSGTFLTAIPDYYATTGDINDLAQSISETYQTKGDYVERNVMDSAIESATSGKLDASSFASVSSDFLVASSLNGYATESFVENTSGAITSLIPTNYYPDTNPSSFVNEDWVTAQGYITGVDLTPYATKTELGDYQTTAGMVDYQTTAGMTAYATTSDVANKLDTTAFSDVSGSFLTAVDLTPYATTSEVDTLSSMLSGAIDYVSANAGGEFPSSANDAITAYQNASGTYLTAHQPISANEWNSVYDTVETNSGSWNEISAVSSNSWPLTASSFTAHNRNIEIQGLTNYRMTLNLNSYSGPYINAEVLGNHNYNWGLNHNRVYGGDINYFTSPAWFLSITGVGSSGGTLNGWFYGSAEYNKLNDSYVVLSTNSATWNDITVYQSHSGTYLTAVDLSNYYTKSETSGADELANAFANIPAGDGEVNSYVHDTSATIDEVNSTVQSNSATWGQGGGVAYSAGEYIDITDNTISVTDVTDLVAGNAITITTSGTSAIISSNGEAQVQSDWDVTDSNSKAYIKNKPSIPAAQIQSDWNQTNTNAKDYIKNKPTIPSYTGASGINVSSNIVSLDNPIGLIAGDNITITVSGTSAIVSAANQGGNPEVESYVQTNSGVIDDVNTTYQNASGTYLTAHQSLDEYATTAWVEEQGYLTAHQDISNKVDLSAYNELKTSYDALSSLFATYSGQWLLPNEGV